ncbi:MAG: hypothetical protein JO102_00970, partial [Elusimicrobia bacterium]|nr:hypothetical protein [Elusimicrobiota bacterium]
MKKALLVVILMNAASPSRAVTSYILKSAQKDSFVTSTLYEAGKPLHHHVGARDRLYFSYGATPATGGRPRTFRFKVAVKSDRGQKVVFNRTIQPDTVVADAGWHRVNVPLADFQGENIEIRFSVDQTEGGAKASPEDALWGGVRVGDFTRKKGDYNVILISLDTLRWDRLSVSGYKRMTSPHIDAIAREGAYF